MNLLSNKSEKIRDEDVKLEGELTTKQYYQDKYRKMVKIVVNHCDSSHKIIGTNKLLRTAIKYGFGIVELSSETGANFIFATRSYFCGIYLIK